MNTSTAWSRFLFDIDRASSAVSASDTTNVKISSRCVPRVLVTEICRYLRVRELAGRLALTSRRGYATVREYGDQLEALWKRKVKADPMDQATIDYFTEREDEILVDRRYHEVFVETCIPTGLIEVVSFEYDLQLKLIQQLTKSRLRNLVVGLDMGKNSLLTLCEVATEMPNLRALRIILLDEADLEFVEFPSSLRHLDLHLNGSPAGDNLTNVVQTMMLALVRCCASNLTRLSLGPHSRRFEDATRVLESPTEVVKTITKLKKLRHLDSGWDDLFFESPHLLRHLPHLTYLGCTSNSYDEDGFADFYNQMLTAPLPFTNLRHYGYNVLNMLLPADVPALSTLHPSLTSLTPRNWRTLDVSWLAPFTRLKYFSLCHAQSIGREIDLEQLSTIISTMTQLVRLHIDLPQLSESHMMRIVTP